MQVLPLYELSFQTVFLMFLAFSFVGWCAEVLYVGIFFEHKFVNRGFLFGPLCPVYGFGGLVILLLPSFLYSTWIQMFFASLVLCTGIEYAASWVLEKMFHTKWWDYSHYKFNIKGRVCLLNSVLFGLMGMLGVHFVIPYVMYGINFAGEQTGRYIAEAAGIILMADIFFTVRQLVDFSASLERIKVFAESLRAHYGHKKWFRSESISEMMTSVCEHCSTKKKSIEQNLYKKIEEMQTHRHRSVEKFLDRFPSMQSSKYHQELNHIRQKKRS